MEFGIYPSKATNAANGSESYKSDDAQKIQQALAKLQGKKQSFLVRAYIHYKGKGQTPVYVPANAEQFAVDGRKLDLVLMYQSADKDLIAWQDFIRSIVTQYGKYVSTLQITEETNVQGAGMDGDFPLALDAMVSGVIAAKQAALDTDLNIRVGFNTAPSFNPADTYWSQLATLASEDFKKALDYVGLDFFPDVFQPIAFDDLPKVTHYILQTYRDNLMLAGVAATVPIHITENGWPTSSSRTDKQQAQVLQAILETINDSKEKYNITRYTYFGLRDADSSSEDLFNTFGLLRDDYSLKPAFEVYRQLVAHMR